MGNSFRGCGLSRDGIGTSLIRCRLRRDEDRHADRRHHEGPVDEPAHARVRGREGRQRTGRELDVLERTGWKKDVTLKVGDTLTFFGWRARDGSPYAHLREATLASGQKLFFGPPAGTGEGPATVR